MRLDHAYDDAGCGSTHAVEGPRDAIYAVVAERPAGRDALFDDMTSRVLYAAGIRWEETARAVLVPDIAPEGERTFTVSPTRLQRATAGLIACLQCFPRLKRVLVLGSNVARVMCPGFKRLEEDHGTLFYHPDLRMRVVPTFKPSQLVVDETLALLFYSDVARFHKVGEPVAPRYVQVAPDELRQLLAEIPEGTHVSLDIETTGNAWSDEITQIGFRWPEAPVLTVYYLVRPDRATCATLLDMLAARRVRLVGSFLQFDLARLYRDAGKPVILEAEDTTIMARLIGEHRLGLKHLTSLYTNRPGPRAYGSWEHEDVQYLAEDVLSAAAVADKLRWHVRDMPIWPVLCRLVPALAAMQYAGVYIDRPRLVQVRERIAAVVGRHHDTLRQYADINWDSPEQVAKYFTAQGARLVRQTSTGRASVDDATLERLQRDYPAAAALREYRDALKVLSFLDEYARLTTDEHPYLHPTLKLDGTRTGRLSATEPNIQQVKNSSKEEIEAGLSIKQLFRSRWPGGSIAQMDLSQIELRILAIVSGDRAMAEALAGDIHTRTAVAVLGVPPDQVTKRDRTIAKRANFGEVYGIGAAKLAQQTGTDIETARRFQAAFRREFPVARAWIERQGEEGVRWGSVQTMFGRWRMLREPARPGVDNSPGGLWRKAVNTPIQSAASDVMLCILDYVVQEKRRRGLRTLPLFPVHDALVLDVYPGEEEAVCEMFQQAFRALHNTPLASYELFRDGVVPVTGEYARGETWEACDFAPAERTTFSS